MSNTPKSVSSDQLNTLKLVKTIIMACFFNPLLCVWISDETLFLVCDILHNFKS